MGKTAVLRLGEPVASSTYFLKGPIYCSINTQLEGKTYCFGSKEAMEEFPLRTQWVHKQRPVRHHSFARSDAMAFVC